MADINITGLPTAGALSDVDAMHISQSGADYQIDIDTLRDYFKVVDIYGLTENASPTTALYVAVSDSSGLLANNRKVSVENLGKATQVESLYANDNDIDLDDKVIYRKDNAALLTQVTLEALRNKALTFNDLSALTSIDQTDTLAAYDTSGSVPVKITMANFRQSVFDPTNLTTILGSGVDNADQLYLYDSSATAAKKITYVELASAIASTISLGSYLSKTSPDTAAGLIDFAGGLKTNTIAPSSGTTVTVNATLNVNNEVASALGNFTNTKGKYLGTNGNASSLYIESSTSGSNNFKVYADDLSPAHSSVDLGASGNRFDNIFGATTNTNVLTVNTSAALPTSTTVNAVALMGAVDNTKINPNLLPVATASSFGTLELATLAEVQANTTAATSQALTASLLAQCIALNNQTSGTKIFNSQGDEVYIGSIKLGGLLINYGWIGDGVTAMSAGNHKVDFEIVGGAGKGYSNTDYAIVFGHMANGVTGSVVEQIGSDVRTASGFTIRVSGAVLHYRVSFITIGRA